MSAMSGVGLDGLNEVLVSSLVFVGARIGSQLPDGAEHPDEDLYLLMLVLQISHRWSICWTF